MSFGLKKLPGFFQSLLNGILSDLQGEKCFVYLDDVVVFAPTLEEHVERLNDVFLKDRQSSLKLNPQKCNFLKSEVIYLGHKFKKVKLALTTPPVLQYPKFDEDFSITCDSSGAVLEQQGHAVAYASRALLDAEKRWSKTELELNAVVYGCKTFKCYLLGRKFKIYNPADPIR